MRNIGNDSKLRQTVNTVLRPAEFDRQVLAFDKTHFPETGTERVDIVLCPRAIAYSEVPDHRHRLLRETALAASKGEQVPANVDTGATLVTKANMGSARSQELLKPKVK